MNPPFTRYSALSRDASRTSLPKSVADFRASLRVFGECEERARELATRWLCWQSKANLRLSLQFGEMQGDFAKLQGQRRSYPSRRPSHLNGLDRVSP